MTNSNDLPQIVRSLLASHIHSVTQLEILLLLYRQPDHAWSGAAVARELRIDPEAAEQQLSDLSSRGFLRLIGQPDDHRVYCYDTSSHNLDRSVQETASTYRQKPRSVIQFIFSKPLEHIRTFSDDGETSSEPSESSEARG